MGEINLHASSGNNAERRIMEEFVRWCGYRCRWTDLSEAHVCFNSLNSNLEVVDNKLFTPPPNDFKWKDYASLLSGSVPIEKSDNHGRAVAIEIQPRLSTSSSLFLAKEQLTNAIGQNPAPFWPNDAEATVMLSHDVDIPNKYGYFTDGLLRGHGAGRPLHWLKQVAGATRAWLSDQERNGHWVFRQVAEAEKKHGFRSTFFVAPVSKFQRGASAFDVPYRLERPAYRNELQRLKNDGFEVGLHSGYDSATHATDHGLGMTAQRKKVEQIAGSEVGGHRHHFWHKGPDQWTTLQKQNEAGLAYDSSFAFADGTGPRNGLVHPFFAINIKTGERSNVLELPPSVMDTSFADQFAGNVNAYVDHLLHLLGLYRSVGGLFVVNWHLRYSYPGCAETAFLGRVYLGFLEALATERHLWVATGSEINLWWRSRHQRLHTTP